MKDYYDSEYIEKVNTKREIRNIKLLHKRKIIKPNTENKVYRGYQVEVMKFTKYHYNQYMFCIEYHRDNIFKIPKIHVYLKLPMQNGKQKLRLIKKIKPSELANFLKTLNL